MKLAPLALLLLLPGCQMVLDPFTRVDHYRWEGRWVRDPAGMYVQCGREMCFDERSMLGN